MFQPEVKAEFVKRYCPPADGWEVFVDIDPSEMGETGGLRKSDESRKRQAQMQQQGRAAEEALRTLGVVVGGSRNAWFKKVRARYPQASIPFIEGDRDIVAIHPIQKRMVIAEAEGDSSGQPEQKLYKAIGQVVIAASSTIPDAWATDFVVVVHGPEIGEHLRKASVLAKTGVAGLCIARDASQDEWLFGRAVLGASGSWAGKSGQEVL